MPICLSTVGGECLPCSGGGKLGPHKEDPALCPYGCDGYTKRGPFPDKQTNKQTNSMKLTVRYVRCLGRKLLQLCRPLKCAESTTASLRMRNRSDPFEYSRNIFFFHWHAIQVLNRKYFIALFFTFKLYFLAQILEKKTDG